MTSDSPPNYTCLFMGYLIPPNKIMPLGKRRVKNKKKIVKKSRQECPWLSNPVVKTLTLTEGIVSSKLCTKSCFSILINYIVPVLIVLLPFPFNAHLTLAECPCKDEEWVIWSLRLWPGLIAASCEVNKRMTLKPFYEERICQLQQKESQLQQEEFCLWILHMGITW